MEIISSTVEARKVELPQYWRGGPPPPEYAPIPNGGRTLLLFLLFAYVLPLYLIYTKWGAVILGLAWYMVIAVASIYVPVLWKMLVGEKMDKWLYQYWRRNVRGGRVVYHNYKDPSIQTSSDQPVEFYYYASQGQPEPSRQYVCLILSIGGWFAPKVSVWYPYYWGPCRVRKSSCPPRWETLVAVSRTDNDDVIDGLSIPAALYVLNNNLTVWRLLDKHFALRADLKAEHEKACVLDEEREFWTNLVVDTVGRIDQTKRFVHSKEGRLIREWLVAEALALANGSSVLRNRLSRPSVATPAPSDNKQEEFSE